MYLLVSCGKFLLSLYCSRLCVNHVDQWTDVQTAAVRFCPNFSNYTTIQCCCHFQDCKALQPLLSTGIYRQRYIKYQRRPLNSELPFSVCSAADYVQVGFPNTIDDKNINLHIKNIKNMFFHFYKNIFKNMDKKH